ncbi:DUF4386 domain-containing protein [Methanolobus sediminis]|uniref:DUF4386 domain-containing protein n=1 Tax=Methanolobus sediminis TaxID=3072978 RepID=A0AA51YJ36_9EURY|nr:DUF4386 domain-containing protein [Methanolobus sediminis]WMW25165.1 DUF4386 domain-containing protein [Methanolobus sediminis]
MKTITKLRILYPAWIVISIFSLLYAPTLASESTLFKVGQLGQIVVQLFQIMIALLLYKLFMETDKEQASLIAIFGILGVPLSLMGILMPEALHLAEVFWGLWLIPIGTLVIRSGMFPKWIGYFLYIGSLGYFGATVSYFLIGSVPASVDIFTMGEVIWALWITFVGAREVRN